MSPVPERWPLQRPRLCDNLADAIYDDVERLVQELLAPAPTAICLPRADSRASRLRPPAGMARHTTTDGAPGEYKFDGSRGRYCPFFLALAALAAVAAAFSCVLA